MIISNNVKEKLESYCSNIIKWNKVYNLVSSSQKKEDIWSRHIEDSIQLYEFISKKNNAIILDLGSGAGFPALPCSIISEDENQELQFIMVESISKKASFLNDTIRLLNLKNITSICDRIENIRDIRADIITARAFAKIEEIFTISENLLKDDTRFILLKGRNIRPEIDSALKKFTFDYQVVNNMNSDGFIFIAENVKNK